MYFVGWVGVAPRSDFFFSRSLWIWIADLRTPVFRILRSCVLGVIHLRQRALVAWLVRHASGVLCAVACERCSRRLPVLPLANSPSRWMARAGRTRAEPGQNFHQRRRKNLDFCVDYLNFCV